MRAERPTQLRARATVLVGVALLGLALLPLLEPAGTPPTLVPWLATAFLLAAVGLLLLARRVRTLRVVAGTLLLGCALLTVLWPEPSTAVIAGLLGTALLGTGVLELAVAVRLPRTADVRFAAASSGVSQVAIGSGVLLWPRISPFTLGIAISLWLVLLGTQAIVDGVHRLRSSGEVEDHLTRRWSPRLRVVGSVAMLLVSVLTAVSAVLLGRTAGTDPGGFYAAPVDLATTTSLLLRAEVVEPFVAGATTYRVLYRSEALQGAPAVASGLVVIPDDPDVPPEGRPILAHTHGTMGIARSCAPSLLGSAYASTMWGVEELVASGWIVAAPDYLGLGAEGDHPYLVGEVTARTTLDVVRAAIELADGQASTRFAVAGHSQGGHAALFTGQRAARDAPDLELLGVAALAPASELAAFIEANDGTVLGNLLAAYAVTAWDRVFDDIDADTIVDPAVEVLMDRIASSCLVSVPEIMGLLVQAELLKLGFLLGPIWSTEPWATRIAENTPGGERFGAPLLLVQGERDSLIRPDIQRGFAARLCSSRQHLQFVEVPGAGHLDVDELAAGQVVAWLNDRAAGRDAPDTCPEEPSPRWDVEPPRERAVPVVGRPEPLPGPRQQRDRTGT
ncbi:MAG: lipase family protein [Nitriliruptoraceae bacterium]